MAGTAGVVESGELARVAAHPRVCPKYPPYWRGDNGVFLFDIAKVKEEVPDIVTWAEVMWRFLGGLFNGSKVKEEPADSWATVLVGLLSRENHECGCPALGQLVHEGGNC